MSPTNLFTGHSTRLRSPAECMTDLTTNTHGKVHHANTVQGWAAYKADKVEWLCLNSDKWGPDETCPYLLMPGTKSVGHGECYKCGHCHMLFDGTPCMHPAVDRQESIYRGVAGKIIRESHVATNPNPRPPPTSPANVASIQELSPTQSLQLVPEADGYPAHYIIVTTTLSNQGNCKGPPV